MPISDDWNIDFNNKIISHIDGNLNWDTGSGTVPSARDFIYNTTTGAVARTLVTFTGTSGTDSVSCVVNGACGGFNNNNSLVRLESITFDNVQNGGFSVGDTITGTTSTRTGVVRAIVYNECGTDGQGIAYGQFTGGTGNFTNDEPLQVGGSTKALAVGTGSGDFCWAGLVSCNLLIPAGTNNTEQIFNFDSGACQISLPVETKIANCGATKTAVIQNIIGAENADTGSIIARCVVGAWALNDDIIAQCVVYFDSLVAGKVFAEGDVISGSSSGAQARVLKIINDGDCTGKLITAGIVCGPFVNADNLTVSCVTIAGFEDCSVTILNSVTDLVEAPRTEQRLTQGGLYASGTSVNVIRSANALYTYLQDTFDELGALDDQVPMTAQVADGQYTLVNSWQIPDLSMRFLASGAIKTSDNNCIWTNYQTLGTIEDVGDKGFYNDATCPTPQPNIYIEQDGSVLRQDWLEGNIDVLIKVKTKKDTTYITPATPGLGQLINNGTVTIFSREYLNTYDHFQTSTIGGTAPIPLNTKNDSNNDTGTHQVTYTGCGGFTVGEEIIGGTTGAIGIVTDECLTSNTVDYALKTTTQFGSAETITGQVSAATATFSSVASLVAGYCTNIRISTVDLQVSGGTGSTGWQTGEQVTQAVTGATGYFLACNTNILYLAKANCTVFSGNNNITGCGSSTVYTAGTNVYCTNQNTFPRDLGDGSGNHNYNAAVGANITDGACTAQPILNAYEWSKYLNRSESTALQGGTGNDTGKQGRIYKSLETTYPEVKCAPYGSFAGGKWFGATGVYIDKCSVATADLQNMQLLDVCGTTVNPPNLQILTISGLVASDTVSVYRTTGACSTTILTTEYTVGSGACDNQSADTTIVVAAGTRCITPLSSDIPDSGVLRIQDPNQCACTSVFLSFPYSSVCRTANTFTLTSGTIGTVTCSTDLRDGDDVFVALIEEAAGGTTATNTIQFVCNIPLLIRVRKKGILPFETTSTFTASGATIGAIRTQDPIVNLP